jgi:nicotinamidase-related amidase
MSLPKEVAGVSQLSMALAWPRVEHVDQIKAPFLRDSPPFQLVSERTPLPTEVIFDKIAMSAFVGTPLDIAMRDCGLNAFAIVGIALEVGIEPTVRHAMDRGYIPVVVTDACGSRDKQAADGALAGLQFTGGSYQTDVATIGRLMRGAGLTRSRAREQ